MKSEAYVVILLKRVHQLEKIVEQLITVAQANTSGLREVCLVHKAAPFAFQAMKTLVNAGVPFDPNCNNCKAELRVINQGTDWECFECPNCEAWYFPQVG